MWPAVARLWVKLGELFVLGPIRNHVASQSGERRVEVHPGKEALVRFDPERTFTCVDSCTWCCEHGVMLYEPDLFQLAEHEPLDETTTTVRGQPFIPREDKERSQHVSLDGAACTFLDDDGRCGLQTEHDWKPTRCSVFPLEVSVEDDEIVVDIREDAERNCEGLDVTERRLIDHLDAFLPPMIWDVPDPSTHVEF